MEKDSTIGLAVVLENGGASKTRDNIDRLIENNKSVKVVELSADKKDEVYDALKNKNIIIDYITSYKQYEEAKAEKDKEMEKEVDYSKYEVRKNDYGYKYYSGKEPMKDANNNKYDYEIVIEPTSDENGSEDKSKEIKESEKIFKDLDIDNAIDYAIEQKFDILSNWGDNNLTKKQMIKRIKKADTFISVRCKKEKKTVWIWFGNNGLPFIGNHSLMVVYDPETKKYNSVSIYG